MVSLALPAFVLCSLYSPWPRNTDFPENLKIAGPLPLSAKREHAKSSPWSEKVFKDMVAKLRKLDPPVQSVAALGIGQLGYFAPEITVIDMLGLTDRHIARSEKQVDGVFLIPGHQKSDASYVLSRRPDVIYIPKLVENAMIPAMVGMYIEPRFPQEYLWDDQLKAYVRRPELRRLTVDTK